ncbi:hypothetical protein GOQ27_14010 [Clostridium sp. D2Q-11]|uniref:Uncharacterized protein n=1 Tax=Anaeromonas frigoriresistens TaxID=2683708 RepID=A0A942UZC2_9FIRM|nr:hypothetical protein [Anaeromonas frigoriresistens]MBS4539584.1 hypothetical protein [Anaeromonas frigoriresistens]
MKKRIIGTLAIAIILVLVFMIVNRGEKGTFEELILDNYKEESYHRVSMTKYPTDENDFIDKRSEKPEDVERLLGIFKDLEIKEVEHSSILDKYYIRLANNNTYESLRIAVLDEKNIYVDVNIIEKIEEDNSTRYASGGKNKNYEATNGEIDIELIEEVFNEMETIEYN